MLGRGAPDQIKDGRTTICAAGYSKTLGGLVRIYPTKITSPLKQWNIVSVPVERNPADTRAESWKIQGSKDEWEHLDRKIKIVGQLSDVEKKKLIPSLTATCVKDLDAQHISLGIIKPTIIGTDLSERQDVDDTIQQTLWGGTLPKTKSNYKLQPRITYRCSACKLAEGHEHDQQIIDWGCYEWFRKNPGKEAQVFENLGITRPDYEKYLLVGNQTHRRKSYLVINVIRWKGPTSPSAVPA